MHFLRSLSGIAVLALAACATTAPPKEPDPAPAQVTLQEYLQRADTAVQAGSRDQSREPLREAAKAYPTSKEPWLKLAQGYFETSDYGNAILSAQEVLQRAPDDQLAHSILAVSGLRVSVSALSQLRSHHPVPSDTQDEAVRLTRMLRESLGETTLLPAPVPQARPAPVRRPAARVAPRAVTPAPAAAAAAAPAAPTAAATPAAPPPRPAGSPFDKLK